MSLNPFCVTFKPGPDPTFVISNELVVDIFVSIKVESPNTDKLPFIVKSPDILPPDNAKNLLLLNSIVEYKELF